MNTKKILLISSDKELSEIIKISALTLTKLNCQVSIIEAGSAEKAIEESASENLNFVILDLDIKNPDPVELIKRIRNNFSTSNKKIISVYSSDVNRQEVHKAGCDSIMQKENFKKAVVNILKF